MILFFVYFSLLLVFSGLQFDVLDAGVFSQVEFGLLSFLGVSVAEAADCAGPLPF
jgi:hypothetical protein